MDTINLNVSMRNIICVISTMAGTSKMLVSSLGKLNIMFDLSKRTHIVIRNKIEKEILK